MGQLKQEYLAQGWGDWLHEEGLSSFDDWWSLELEAVEEGNFDRGGISAVYRFHRSGRTFYVKRQTNRVALSFKRFPPKVPTFKVEFDQIQNYQAKGVPSLDPVYFSWRRHKGALEAVIVTEALLGFLPLDELQAQPLTFSQKSRVSVALGRAVRLLHDAGIAHYNLYPKHIFVNLNDSECLVRFIDLETSRSNLGLKRRKLRDLETLSRHAVWANKCSKLRAFLAYLGESSIDQYARQDLKQINARTLKKLAR